MRTQLMVMGLLLFPALAHASPGPLDPCRGHKGAKEPYHFHFTPEELEDIRNRTMNDAGNHFAVGGKFYDVLYWYGTDATVRCDSEAEEFPEGAATLWERTK